MPRPAAYIANPLGFFAGNPKSPTPEGKEILSKIVVPMVERAGFTAVEPFAKADAAFRSLAKIEGAAKVKEMMCEPGWTRGFIGNLNETLINGCSAVLAILEAGPCLLLDGDPKTRVIGKIPHKPFAREELEVDLGTGVEVGIAGEIAKRRFMRVIGVRTTAKDAGEVGQPVNLQAVNSIRNSGGQVARNWADAETLLRETAKSIESLLARSDKKHPLELGPRPAKLSLEEQLGKKAARAVFRDVWGSLT